MSSKSKNLNSKGIWQRSIRLYGILILTVSSTACRSSSRTKVNSSVDNPTNANCVNLALSGGDLPQAVGAADLFLESVLQTKAPSDGKELSEYYAYRGEHFYHDYRVIPDLQVFEACPDATPFGDASCVQGGSASPYWSSARIPVGRIRVSARSCVFEARRLDPENEYTIIDLPIGIRAYCGEPVMAYLRGTAVSTEYQNLALKLEENDENFRKVALESIRVGQQLKEYALTKSNSDPQTAMIVAGQHRLSALGPYVLANYIQRVYPEIHADMLTKSQETTLQNNDDLTVENRLGLHTTVNFSRPMEKKSKGLGLNSASVGSDLTSLEICQSSNGSAGEKDPIVFVEGGGAISPGGTDGAGDSTASRLDGGWIALIVIGIMGLAVAEIAAIVHFSRSKKDAAPAPEKSVRGAMSAASSMISALGNDQKSAALAKIFRDKSGKPLSPEKVSALMVVEIAKLSKFALQGLDGLAAKMGKDEYFDQVIKERLETRVDQFAHSSGTLAEFFKNSTPSQIEEAVARISRELLNGLSSSNIVLKETIVEPIRDKLLKVVRVYNPALYADVTSANQNGGNQINRVKEPTLMPPDEYVKALVSHFDAKKGKAEFSKLQEKEGALVLEEAQKKIYDSIPFPYPEEKIREITANLQKELDGDADVAKLRKIFETIVNDTQFSHGAANELIKKHKEVGRAITYEEYVSIIKRHSFYEFIGLRLRDSFRKTSDALVRKEIFQHYLEMFVQDEGGSPNGHVEDFMKKLRLGYEVGLLDATVAHLYDSVFKIYLVLYLDQLGEHPKISPKNLPTIEDMKKLLEQVSKEELEFKERSTSSQNGKEWIKKAGQAGLELLDEMEKKRVELNAKRQELGLEDIKNDDFQSYAERSFDRARPIYLPSNTDAQGETDSYDRSKELDKVTERLAKIDGEASAKIEDPKVQEAIARSAAEMSHNLQNFYEILFPVRLHEILAKGLENLDDVKQDALETNKLIEGQFDEILRVWGTFLQRKRESAKTPTGTDIVLDKTFKPRLSSLHESADNPIDRRIWELIARRRTLLELMWFESLRP